MAKGERGKSPGPFTEQEWIEKFRQLVPLPKGGEDQYDWVKLFLEYIRSTQSEYRSMQHFCSEKEISYAALQTRGGTALWNRARKAVQLRALSRAIKKSDAVLVQKYEKEISVSHDLVEVIKRVTRRLLRASESLPDGSDPPMNPYEIGAVKSLAESLKLLAEVNMKLYGDSRITEDPARPIINIQELMIKATEERDKQLGIDG